MAKLNLNLLRTLAVLLAQRNVSRAAEELRLTQSAISRQLSQLREYFNDPLLIREGNDYLLTSKAQQLIPQLQDILSQVDDLRGEPGFTPAACARRFSFACTDYVANFIFPDVLTDLHSEADQIDISYRIWRPQWLSSLATRPIDFFATMIDDVPDNLYGVHLGADAPALVMARNHPLSGQIPVTLEQILDYPYVSITAGGDKDRFFDIELNRQRKQRRVAFEVPFYASAFNVVAGGEMLLIVPRHIAMNAARSYSIVYRDLPLENLPTHNYYLLWHSIHHHDPAHRWVRDRIARVLRESIFSPQGMN
ncbi:LysR family transcriptional regulator [Marinobacter halodurans]|uniref:LysR family transcriptional regulator n=1 Tax=Marinobacter halodurans TaxID=2528979 RepID=A0ABY1ZDT9_9GAMM|nr:LysR family transcriptional regulator [Marinobacter halodurans]TBW46895.1 LysR family transcriptional regulator [Marinobacter halodurans]